MEVLMQRYVLRPERIFCTFWMGLENTETSTLNNKNSAKVCTCGNRKHVSQPKLQILVYLIVKNN